jgi:hypothetical protein
MYHEASNGFNYPYNKMIFILPMKFIKIINFHLKTFYYSIRMYISKDNIDKISTIMNVNNASISHDM